MSQNALEFPIKLTDQWGKPLKLFSEGVDSASKKVSGLGSAQQKAFSDIKKPIATLRDNIARYRDASEKSFRTDHIKKYNILISETEKKIKKLEHSTSTCGEKSEGFFSKLKGNLGITPGLLGVGGVIYGLGKTFSFAKESYSESIKAASEVQKYQVSLQTMLGSTEKARDRMQEYFAIAKKTPFQLNEVVEAGNKLQAIGKYSQDNLVMIGDLAAASGKPMEQAMAAYTKLIIGEKGMAMNMFRDLLITTDDWTKATGKGVSKNGELLATTQELAAVLPQIMKSKGYFGMMANQSETTEGKVSNLKDTYYQLQVAIGERLKPAYESWVVSLTKSVDKMREYYQIPVTQKIAAEKTELNLLVESLISHNGTQEQRKQLIDDINRKYPGLFENLDLEKAKTSEIRSELEKVNAEYDKKMRKASYQRMKEKIEGEMSESADDVSRYQMSIAATKRIEELKNEYRKLHKDITGTEGNAETSTQMLSYAKEYSERGVAFKVANYKGGGQYKLTPEEQAKFSAISGEFSANLEFQNFFTSWDEERKAKAQKEYEKQKQKLATIDKIINDELGVITGDSANNNKSGGRAETVTTTSGDTTKRVSGVEQSAEVISGGGKNVKNFNITIGNLIGENTNQFSASTDNPQSAADFVQRFGDTLQMLVNEMNYADN